MVAVKEKYVALPSDKHHGVRSRTQILAVHSAECPMERGYARSLTAGFLNIPISSGGPAASINGFADPGCFVRSVNTFCGAWHASWANTVSVGYETAAYAAYNRETWMSLEGRRMLERLAIEMAADAEIFDIPLRWLTGAQVNAIRNGNTKIKGLAAHRQIDPAHRTDPGDGFPYGYLLKRIKHHSGAKVQPAVDKSKTIVQEDDMPEHRFCEQTNGSQALKKGEWTTVEIQDGSGRTAICDGAEANLVSAVGNIYAKGIADGYSLKIEWARYDAEKKKYEHGFGAVEVPATAGGCQGEVSVLCNMPAGKEEQLVLRAFTYQDDVRIETARARAFWWK